MSSLKMFFLIFLSSLLTGCGVIGNKAFSLSSIYCATAVLALLLLIFYLHLFPKRDRWFLLLFSSIFVVNTGYFILSISQSLEMALWANRIAYLGSAMLPLAMLMIIFYVCKICYSKWIPYLFFGISFIVFLIAASPGYLNIYYQSVSLETINGVSMLKKVYGPWHSIYLFYLVIYFSLMIASIILATKKGKIESNIHAIILALAVFVNIGVWLIEQLVHIDFEFLSISYIICESFLLALHVMIQDNTRILLEIQQANESIIRDAANQKKVTDLFPISESQYQFFTEQLPSLTPTEQLVYHLYLEGKTTKEILKELDIKENTLKYHNRNIYSKLGVSSRKQLLQIATSLECYNTPKTT